MDISIEDFKIIEKIGEGAFGAVYLAIFKPSGDRVAIKRVKKEACTIKVIKRCRREARIMRKVHHPSIVNFYGSFETDTSFFIIMEYVAGRTLSEVIHSSSYNSSILETPNDNHFAGNYHTKGLPESMAMKYFIELACAIRYLHNYVKVVHRDIKLDNIIVDTNGHLKLLDFGFSNTEENSDSVLFNTACGTIGYTAPEIIKRECYDKKVDIWSIGVILYSMVTGNLPFFHENLQEACRLIVTGEPSYPPYLSSEMIELISKLLSKSPKT
ncbi:CAMK family protein kinase [Tritrichomonas foetus]|uniref:non-specific serine/threonine protein kinase n=1 Tax=Tritrichomonas foetus TaxID=1144522 RepID=A0A1J4K940_9EUKA|nr:CAMK family protein kinase [Tritrichomonas foetus]|eukprot:OHT07731.1 CAMK family protein kinase [Tritrichomonas foetus]